MIQTEVNFCINCGTARPPAANFCPHCGTAFDGEAEGLSDTHYLAASPITYRNFFPRTLNALESLSVSSVLGAFSSVRLMLLRPQEYPRMMQQGRLVPLFTLLMLAPFAQTIHYLQYPQLKPYWDLLHTDNDLTNSLVQILVVVGQSNFFGLLFFTVFSQMHRLAYVRNRIPNRDVFVRAMLYVLVTFVFLEGASSLLWMPFFLQSGLPMGSAETIRFGFVLLYAWIVFRNIAASSPSVYKSHLKLNG